MLLIRNFFPQIIKEFSDHPPEMLTSPTAHPAASPASSMFYMPPNVGGPYVPFVYSSVPHTVANEGGSSLTDMSTRRPAPPPPPVSAVLSVINQGPGL